MLTLEAVNRMSRKEFVDTLGGVFEHSPWVADRAWGARPFASPGGLHRAMMDVVKAATDEEQVRLLQAHPELAGKEARERRMTNDSIGEQGSAGLDRLSDAEYAQFDRLNASYNSRFGFPFIIAVRGRGKDAVLAEFERRLRSDRTTEISTALDEVSNITKMRLSRLIGQELD